MVAAPLSCVMPAAQPSAVNPPPPTIATSGHDAVRGTSSRGRRKWQRSLNDWRLVGQFRFSNLCVWFLLCMCCSGAEGSLRMATPSCCTQVLWSQRRLTVLSYICNGALLARCVSLRGWLLVPQKNFLGVAHRLLIVTVLRENQQTMQKCRLSWSNHSRCSIWGKDKKISYFWRGRYSYTLSLECTVPC